MIIHPVNIKTTTTTITTNITSVSVTKDKNKDISILLAWRERKLDKENDLRIA